MSAPESTVPSGAVAVRPQLPDGRSKIGSANTARQAALFERNGALLSVAGGLLSLWDVLEAARDSRSLGKIHLRQLLLAEKGSSPSRATATLKRTLRSAGAVVAEGQVSRINVDWLLDPRTGGRRLMAFADAISAGQDDSPWPGFPFAPETTEVEEVRATWMTR